MLNRTITWNHIVVATAWAVGLVIIVADILADSWDNIGVLGLAIAFFGGVRQIGGYIDCRGRREREWFELGKETADRRPRGV